MMAAAKANPILAERLVRLAENAECSCLPDYQARARQIRHGPEFPTALKRAKALADDNRLLAVFLLKQSGELCACEIQAATSLSHATVSHHMTRLVAAGLVAERRQGKWLYYRLAGEPEVKVP